MIYSNEKGSVIESQFCLIDEITKEVERCKDWRYWYINYARIVKQNGEIIKPKYSSIINLRFDNKIYGWRRR